MGKFAVPVLFKFPEKKSVLIERRLLLLRFPKKLATWNPKDSANTLLSWYLFLSLPKSVLTSPRKSALAPEPTQGRFRNLWLRSGAMFQLLNLALLKIVGTTGQKKP